MIRDLQFAIRSLVKQPGFTVVSVVTLMLAIGVNTTIFSVVNTVLLRALPFRDPDQLVKIEVTFVIVSALFFVIAMFASFIPARRAAQVDPLVALRYE